MMYKGWGWRNKDGTIDISILEILVLNGWALNFEIELYRKYKRFNLGYKKSLPFKK